MNKTVFLYVIWIVFLLSSCEYDNYEEPSLFFSGKLVSKGERFLHDGNPAKPVLQLFQKGYGKVDAGTDVRVDEEGHFSQLIFPGEYWLTLNNIRYPFEFQKFTSFGAGLGYDSVYMKINFHTTEELEVIPYYNITNFTAAIENNNIVLRCMVSRNEEIKDLVPNVIFGRGYVSTSSKVNSATICTKSKRAVISRNGSIEIEIPVAGNAPSYRGSYINNYRDYAFCRIAIELNGIPQYYLFSGIKKIEGIPQ
jgi:hypothetical protein